MAKRDIKGTSFNSGIFPERLKMALNGQVGKYKGTIITQKQLAKDIGVKPQTIGQYVNSVSVPGAQNLADIADYFGLSADYLLGITDVSSPSAQMAADYLGVQERTINNIKSIDPIVLDFLFYGKTLYKRSDLKYQLVLAETGEPVLSDYDGITDDEYSERKSLAYSIDRVCEVIGEYLRENFIEYHDDEQELVSAISDVLTLATKGQYSVENPHTHFEEGLQDDLRYLGNDIISELKRFRSAPQEVKREIFGNKDIETYSTAESLAEYLIEEYARQREDVFDDDNLKKDIDYQILALQIAIKKLNCTLSNYPNTEVK